MPILGKIYDAGFDCFNIFKIQQYIFILLYSNLAVDLVRILAYSASISHSRLSQRHERIQREEAAAIFFSIVSFRLYRQKELYATS